MPLYYNKSKIYETYSKQYFSDEIHAYLDELPVEFRNNLNNIEFLIEDYPPDELIDRYENISDFTLGLYSGVPMPKKSIFQRYSLPDIIYLFRIPILTYHRKSNKPLRDIIQGVLRHEIAHYFGYSDDDLHAEDLYNP